MPSIAPHAGGHVIPWREIRIGYANQDQLSSEKKKKKREGVLAERGRPGSN